MAVCMVMYKATVYLPDELKAALVRTAAETGRSEAEIIRSGLYSAQEASRSVCFPRTRDKLLCFWTSRRRAWMRRPSTSSSSATRRLPDRRPRMADLIVVLESGRIKEAGSHQALMSSGGLYAELYELQARAYR